MEVLWKGLCIVRDLIYGYRCMMELGFQRGLKAIFVSRAVTYGCISDDSEGSSEERIQASCVGLQMMA